MRDQSGLTFGAAGVPTFLRSALQADLSTLDADIAVLGVPTDEGSPYIGGSRFAPRAIREQSLRFPIAEGLWDEEAGNAVLEPELTGGRIADAGDVDVFPTEPARTFEGVTAAVRAVLGRGAFPVVLGGDHALSFAVVRAFDEPLHVLHFDAHMDYMPFIHGMEYTNANAFRHIRAMPHVREIVQAGIRSIRNPERFYTDARQDGNRIVSVEGLRRMGAAGLAESFPAGANLYISLDIDVLDLPLAIGCASGEPNGLLYEELRDSRGCD